MATRAARREGNKATKAQADLAADALAAVALAADALSTAVRTMLAKGGVAADRAVDAAATVAADRSIDAAGGVVADRAAAAGPAARMERRSVMNRESCLVCAMRFLPSGWTAVGVHDPALEGQDLGIHAWR